MKKILIASISILYLVTTAHAERIKVLTSYPYIADIVQKIGKEHVRVHYLARGNWDPHTVIPRPSFIAKVRRADLLIINGGQLEIGYLPPILKQANNADVFPGRKGFLDLSSSITMIDVPRSVSRAQGDMHPDGNPHYYLDPHNIPPLAKAITKKLCELDYHNASNYRNNQSVFLNKWNSKLAEWDRKLKSLQGISVVEYHKNFDYLLRRYGIKLVGTVEPLPGIPPTSRHMETISQIIARHSVKFIIHDVYHPERASKLLAKKHNIRMVVLPHDVGATNEAEGIFSLFDEIVRRLSQ